MTTLLTKNLGRIRKCGAVLNTSLFDARPKLAYVGGWLGKRNLGDEALFAAYRSLFPNFAFLPYDGGRLADGIVRRVPVGTGLLAGGTLIGEQRDVLQTAARFVESPARFAIFGTGVESADFWPGEDTLPHWIPILSRALMVGVRGPISAEILSDIGVENVEVVGDPVVTFARSSINPDPEAQTLGLNLGLTDGRLWGGSEQRLCSAMTELARVAKRANWRVKWFVVWPKDLPLTKAAATASGTDDQIVEIYDDHEEFIAQARPLTVFVGMKLHATILATCALTPSIMLEYRPKCRDYMRSLGLDDYTIRTSEFDAAPVWERVLHISRDRTSVANQLCRALENLKRAQRNRAATLGDLLLQSQP